MLLCDSEAERKTILDQTFRDVLKEKLQTNDLKLTDLVTLATSCVKEGIASLHPEPCTVLTFSNLVLVTSRPYSYNWTRPSS